MPIIDLTSEGIDFLSWINESSYTVELSSDSYGWFKATLKGTKLVWSGYGDTIIKEFVGFGKTKEKALDELKASMSNKDHYPYTKGSLKFLFDQGPCHRFPTFK